MIGGQRQKHLIEHVTTMGNCSNYLKRNVKRSSRQLGNVDIHDDVKTPLARHVLIDADAGRAITYFDVQQRKITKWATSGDFNNSWNSMEFRSFESCFGLVKFGVFVFSAVILNWRAKFLPLRAIFDKFSISQCIFTTFSEVSCHHFF